MRKVRSTQMGNRITSFTQFVLNFFHHATHSSFAIEHCSGLFIAFHEMTDMVKEIVVNFLVLDDADHAAIDLRIEDFMLG